MTRNIDLVSTDVVSVGRGRILSICTVMNLSLMQNGMSSAIQHQVKLRRYFWHTDWSLS